MEIDLLPIITACLAAITAFLLILSSKHINEILESIEKWRVNSLNKKHYWIFLGSFTFLISFAMINSVVYVAAINYSNTIHIESNYIGLNDTNDIFRITAYRYSGQPAGNVIIFSTLLNNDTIIYGPHITDSVGNAIVPIPQTLNKNFTIKAYYRNLSINQKFQDGVQLNPIQIGILDIINSMLPWIIVSIIVSLIAGIWIIQKPK